MFQNFKIDNPWVNVSDKKRKALTDSKYIENYQKNKNGKFLFSTVELPEPFIGSPRAPIYILLGSPGMGSKANNYSDLKKQIEFEENNEYLSFIKPLVFKNCNWPYSDIEYPFYPLNPSLAKFDISKNKTHAFHREFWRFGVFNRLINEFKIKLNLQGIKEEEVLKVFANAFFNIELYGYHSHKTEHSILEEKNRLPSVKYNIKLITEAIREDKIILMPRAVNTWFSLVPELATYPKAYFVKVNRSIEINKSTVSPFPYGLLMTELKKIHDEILPTTAPKPH